MIPKDGVRHLLIPMTPNEVHECQMMLKDEKESGKSEKEKEKKRNESSRRGKKKGKKVERKEP